MNLMEFRRHHTSFSRNQYSVRMHKLRKIEGNLQVVQNACMRKRLGRDGLAQKLNHKEVSMSAYYYIGLDIHKRTISYCIKAIDGSLVGQGR